MSLHGSVNHTIWRPHSNQEVQFRHAFNDEFVATYRFLNSPIAAGMGIVRRACNFNNQASDCDYKHRQSSPPPGNNAWALFEFTSANLPFWLLIQQSDSSNNDSFGVGAGEPADNDWSRRISGFCFSVALREDGGSPWGGTTNNNGTDVKSRPVWTPGPSRLAMFPISNGPKGQWRVDRSGMHPVSLWIDFDASRTRITTYHFLANEDSITFLVGHDGGYNYDVTYFGKYNPINASRAPTSYAFLGTITDNLGFFNTGYSDELWPWHGGGGLYGMRYFGSNVIGMSYANFNSPTGQDYYWTGGILDTNSFTAVPMAVSLPMQIHYFRYYARQITLNPALKKIDVFNFPVAVDGLSRGIVGEISNIKYTHTLPHHSTIHGRKFAVFGRSRPEGKIMAQWSPLVTPGKYCTVFGEQF